MNKSQSAIVRTLIYFEIFHHPLTGDELYGFLRVPLDRRSFETELETLVTMGIVGHEGDYYFLVNGNAGISERIRKLKRAEKAQRTAKRFSRLIALHPFVRGVFLSGSLSKNSFAEKDDIDYFVVTEPGRLWLCRTLLMLFKKMFLLNSKKYFCINYYVDSRSLEIPDRNLFTATELAFLKPVQNERMYSGFMEANKWIIDYFPNLDPVHDGHPAYHEPWLKRMAERALNGKTGDGLDDYLMKVYRDRSVRKYRHNGDMSFELNFRSEKNVAKHHPDGYQEKTLEKYFLLTRQFEKTFGIDLTASP